MLLLFVSALQADVMYTSQAAFDAATTNATDITFTAPSPTTFQGYMTYTDATTGTQFHEGSSFVNLTGADYYGPGVYPADFLVESGTAFAVANPLTLTLPAGFNTIGVF
jgi:hypothetical protein